MAAGSSIFRLVHIPTRPPLLSHVSEIYGVTQHVCVSGPERAACVDPATANWKSRDDRREN